jgi:hypothetical protein
LADAVGQVSLDDSSRSRDVGLVVDEQPQPLLASRACAVCYPSWQEWGQEPGSLLGLTSADVLEMRAVLLVARDAGGEIGCDVRCAGLTD